MGGKRMQPMTPEHRHNVKRTLRFWLATTKYPFIEFPENEQLPTGKMPLQYGTKKKTAHHTAREQYGIICGRNEKAMMQNHNEPLSKSDYYELYWEEPIARYTPVESDRTQEYLQQAQAYAEAQTQAQKQRFYECAHALYYSKTRKN